MEIVKKFGLPATLAVAGVEASKFVGVTKTWQQVLLAIVGAGVGLAIASKI